MSLEELLEFESDGAVLDFRFRHDGLLLWPFVRWGVFLEALRENLLARPAEGRRRPGPWTAAQYLARSWRRDPLRESRSYDILMFGSTTGLVPKEGEWFGRINDYFALQAPGRTLVVDQAQDMRYRWPRAVPHAARHDGIKIRAELKRRLMGGLSMEDERSIDGFLGLLRRRLPLPLPDPFYAALGASLRRIAGRLRFLHDDYRRLFDRLRPRIVFLEDASYGTENYIVKWAKDAGVKTGEFQHGMIVPSHHAYNYGSGPRENADYRRTLPDYLLTYGPFWNENARTPSEKIAVGNPHLAARLKGRRRAEVEKLLVILSQPDAATELVGLAREAAGLLERDGWRVAYRLHPLESASDPVYGPLRDWPDISISVGGDVYDLLERAGAVAGVYSTALFEAAGLGRPALVYDNAASRLFIPRRFGTWFRGVEELRGILAGGLPLEEPGLYWAEDWEGNYRRFLEEKVHV